MDAKPLLVLAILTVLIPMSQAQTTENVFVVGLDGASYEMLQSCLEKDGFENMQELASTAKAPLQAPLPPLTPVNMASFLTGTNPGGHGIYGFEKQKPFSYDTQLVHSGFLPKTFPEQLNTTSVLVNVPMTYPAPEIDGAVVAGFPGSMQGKYAHPPQLKKRLQEMNYSINTAGQFETYGQLRDTVFDLLEKRKELSIDLMQEYDWDLFMTMFTGDARLQHFQAYDGCSGDLERFYQEVDSFIGEAREHLPDNTTILLFSNHGFTPLQKKMYMYSFLKDTGYLEPKRWQYYRHMAQAAARSLLDTVAFWRDGGDTVETRAAFSSKYMDEINWEKTQAYTGSFYNGQIFLNDDGVEPNGDGSTEQLQAVKENIIADVKDIQDPETGEPIVETAYTKNELYSGPYMDEMPDIVIETPGYNHIAKFGFWRLFNNNPVEQSTPIRTGFIAANRNLTHDKPTITDLTATITDLLETSFGEGDTILER